MALYEGGEGAGGRRLGWIRQRAEHLAGRRSDRSVDKSGTAAAWSVKAGRSRSATLPARWGQRSVSVGRITAGACSGSFLPLLPRGATFNPVRRADALISGLCAPTGARHPCRPGPQIGARGQGSRDRAVHRCPDTPGPVRGDQTEHMGRARKYSQIAPDACPAGQPRGSRPVHKNSLVARALWRTPIRGRAPPYLAANRSGSYSHVLERGARVRARAGAGLSFVPAKPDERSSVRQRASLRRTQLREAAMSFARCSIRSIRARGHPFCPRRLPRYDNFCMPCG